MDREDRDRFFHWCVGVLQGFALAFALIDLGWISTSK